MIEEKFISRPRVEDAVEIYKIIAFFAGKNIMLPRTLNEIYENLRDFWIYKKNKRIYGCCALHIIGWQDLAEIRSLAVKGPFQNKGLGRLLVERCLREAKELGIKRVFVLTFIPDFFKDFGFKPISKNKLPHKIWTDCLRCAYFPNCKEVSLIKRLR